MSVIDNHTTILQPFFNYKLISRDIRESYHSFVCSCLNINVNNCKLYDKNNTLISENEIKIILFLSYRKNNVNAYCSNLFSCPPYKINMLDFLIRVGVDYNISEIISNHMIICSEQALLIIKAAIMKDYHTVIQLLQIVNSKGNDDDPIKNICNIVKKFSREIKNFDQNIWKLLLPEVIIRILLEKFRSEYMKNLLFTHKSNILFAKLALYDPIWGVAIKSDNSDTNNILLWRGCNILGYALTAVFQFYSQSNQSKDSEESLYYHLAKFF